MHEGGFGCERKPDGRIVFTNPFGDEIPDSVQLQSVPQDHDPFEWLRNDLADLDIDADTARCRWQGEKIDWPLAIEHLVCSERISPEQLPGNAAASGTA